jgi:hypothetical protein
MANCCDCGAVPSMPGTSALLKAARHSKRIRRGRQCNAKAALVESCTCMGSSLDGHAKCCQVDALARQLPAPFGHAIWRGMQRIGQCIRPVAELVCMRLRSITFTDMQRSRRTRNPGLQSWKVVEKNAPRIRFGLSPACPSCPSITRCVILVSSRWSKPIWRQLAMQANATPSCRKNLALDA